MVWSVVQLLYVLWGMFELSNNMNGDTRNGERTHEKVMNVKHDKTSYSD